ncbi:MAG TPA: serine hydrolase domain-containing protein [Pseudomonadales bacterium]|nr:serine hydrolase domain-containing protein [Pseudomonadales bacterium]
MAHSGLSSARLTRMHDVMAGHVERGDVPGLVTLLCRRGDVHVDAIGTLGVGQTAPMQRDTIFRIASMSKPITAVATLILVEECKLRLDEPVDRWLPELADRRVLARLDADVSDTVPAQRPITTRDLLTFRLGFGLVLARPGRYPIQAAIADAGLAPGPNSPRRTPDEYMKALGSLPLLAQPGEQWLYHTGSDVLGVLIERVSGQSFPAFLDERVFRPLGMKDTAFHVPPEKIHRLPTSYVGSSKPAELLVADRGPDGRFSREPLFASGGGGLVSTVDDYLAFCTMLLNKGRVGTQRLLSRPAVELMTTDHLTHQQKADSRIFFSDYRGWGFGLAVTTRRGDFGAPGRFGWDGGAGTSGYTDPAEDLIGVLMTQRMMDSPQWPRVFSDFWTSAYAAIDD